MPHLFRVIVPVGDINRAARFHGDLLGDAGQRISPGRHYFDCEGTILACYDPGADGDGRAAIPLPEPIYIAVDDLESTYQRAEGAGASFSTAVVPDVGPLGQIARRPWGEQSFYATDPFGKDSRPMQIRWARVGFGALALEAVLFAVLVPISVVNQTVFLVAVPIGVFVFAFLLTRWLLRPVTAHLLLHGALIGVIATALYFGLVAAQPGGLGAALAVYGAPLFWFSQALRIIGCLGGAADRQRRQPMATHGTSSGRTS